MVIHEKENVYWKWKKNKIGATSTKVKFLKKLYLKIDRLVYKTQMCHLLHF